ncbi:beta-ketoacyl-ACP synthase II [Adlercreutzia sp. ZJ304]|uniref:beta-ketoacyl-ACP synthase II n=1 Tax=Adlercreutzia sp. ZJ304 TaxID=2709791 RepID=UPI001F14B5AE|nr:beta-ketoacyl-ACP synthase II [Adlercreutzia sp. ZJ304]
MSKIENNRNNTIEPRRVVITGMGAVSPAGIGVDALFNAAVDGKCAISPLENEVAEAVNIHVAGLVHDFDAIQLGLTKKQARRWEKFVQYAVVAADEAMKQANLVQNSEDNNESPWQLSDGIDAHRFAVVFGSGIGGMDTFTNESVKLHEKGGKRVSPLFIPTIISNIAAGELAIRFGLKGECTNCVVACATGTQCIGDAYRLIRFGIADRALCGGAEESISDISIAGFANLGALTHESDPLLASRPFDINRSGFVAGEGAGALVLESLDSALERNAHIIAEIVGFGATGDAYHITAPEPSGEGVARAMQMALDEAGFEPSDIGHLNAHGTSTGLNDSTEAHALCKLLDTDKADIPVTSTKGITGHMLGAAGAIEAIVCALSLANNLVPPTAGFAEADPECPVTVLTEALRNYPQKIALSNSIGFGGHNTTLALAPYQE